MPFTKSFNPGEILTAADVNDHLLNGGYQYRETIYFTSSDEFVKADFPWLRAIRVRCQGGGGGGGGAASTGAGQTAMGVNGSAGNYAESFITDIAGLDASVTVTRGSGGGGGAAGNNAGANGVDSSFGTLVVGGGGIGAGGGGAGAGFPRWGGSPPEASATAVGDLVVFGDASDSNNHLQVDFIQSSILPGSFLAGAKRQAIVAGNNGAPGNLFGGGGGGGGNTASQATARAGGAGGNGIVIVDLFG